MRKMRCSCFLLDFPVSKRNIFFSFLLLTRCNKLLSGVTRVMTACIAFQLLVASLQLHKWKLITVSSFAENFGSGFKKRKKNFVQHLSIHLWNERWALNTEQEVESRGVQQKWNFFSSLTSFSKKKPKCLKLIQKVSFYTFSKS